MLWLLVGGPFTDSEAYLTTVSEVNPQYWKAGYRRQNTLLSRRDIPKVAPLGLTNSERLVILTPMRRRCIIGRIVVKN
jgi:hypothetical protein